MYVKPIFLKAVVGVLFQLNWKLVLTLVVDKIKDQSGLCQTGLYYKRVKYGFNLSSLLKVATLIKARFNDIDAGFNHIDLNLF